MLAGSTIAVIVPAFNVESRLPGVLATMPAFVDVIVVVDDASLDGTSRVARARASVDPRVHVLRHDANRGVGGALATGYRAALDHGADVLAVMAGDGQMDPSDLARVVLPVATDRADYAKGNRLRYPGVWRAMPPARWIGNLALSAMTRAATGLWHVGDSQCGYTAVHRRVLAALDPSAMWARYGYPNHLLGALSRCGFRVQDVVVRPVYAGERSGVRMHDAVFTIPRILWSIGLARWNERRAALPGPRGFVQIR